MNTFQEWQAEAKKRLRLFTEATKGLATLGPPPVPESGQDALDFRHQWGLPAGQPATASQTKAAADRLLDPVEAARKAIVGYMQEVDNQLADVGRRGDKAIVCPEMLANYLTSVETVVGQGIVVFATPPVGHPYLSLLPTGSRWGSLCLGKPEPGQVTGRLHPADWYAADVVKELTETWHQELTRRDSEARNEMLARAQRMEREAEANKPPNPSNALERLFSVPR
jgi:hypothetical protein